MESKINYTVLCFPIEHTPFANCIQDVFITYLKWKGKEYRRLYDNMWSFGFCGKNSYDIDVYRNGFTQIYDSLERNFAIQVIVKKNKTVDDIAKILSMGEPILAEVDTFYCEWHKTFNKIHNQHFVIIVGMDCKNIFCIDPYMSKQIEEIRLTNWNQAIVNILYLKKQRRRSNNWKESLIKELNIVLGKTSGVSDFDQMREFVFKLQKGKTEFIKEVKSYESIAFFPMLLKLNNIGFGRKCFASYLELISEDNDIGELKLFTEKLEKEANEWSRCSSLFIKYILLDFSDTIEQKIYDKLYQIAIDEEKIAKALYTFIC